MKKFMSTCCLCCLAIFSKAQLPYIFSYLTGQPYTPLSSATNISSGVIWNDESWIVPIGFNFTIADSVLDRCKIVNSNLFFASDTDGVISGFLIAATDFADRGLVAGTPQSPVRYATEGTSPNRIFKLEYQNAGFFDEKYLYGTMDDSADFQIWLYETSGIIEFHFGPSQVVNNMDYFYLGNGPLSGYAAYIDPYAGTFKKVYCLRGNPSAPVLDSFGASATAFTLNDYPANGTVYRFTPKTTYTANDAFSQQLKVYPTNAHELLFVDNAAQITAAYELMSISGQATLSGKLQPFINKIDISGLPAGIYVLHVISAEGKAVYKFIKE